jgi:hypothetical protein
MQTPCLLRRPDWRLAGNFYDRVLIINGNDNNCRFAWDAPVDWRKDATAIGQKGSLIVPWMMAETHHRARQGGWLQRAN